MLFGILRMWLLGLWAVALWAAAAGLGYYWYDRLPDPRPVVAVEPDGERIPNPPPTFRDRVAAWRPGADWPTAALAGAALLAAWSLGGGLFFNRLTRRGGPDEPTSERGGSHRRLRRPDGSELHVEVHGPPDGPTVVLTHGWGANSICQP